MDFLSEVLDRVRLGNCSSDRDRSFGRVARRLQPVHSLDGRCIGRSARHVERLAEHHFFMHATENRARLARHVGGCRDRRECPKRDGGKAEEEEEDVLLDS